MPTSTPLPDAATTLDPFARAAQAAQVLTERTGVERHDVVVVAGSGWAAGTSALGEGVEIPLAELPGFPPPTAAGHGASARSVSVGGLRVLVLLGRVHLYEGHHPSVVAHGIRTAATAGCRIAVLTNAAGSLRREWPIGQPVLISDHINLTGVSPLTGAAPPAGHGERFVDLTDAYSPRLRALARSVDATLAEGIYVGFHGPEFETPAEVRMAGVLGGDLVGMSTVLETIAARQAGLEVLGLSLATNLAAGVSPVPLDGAHVLNVAAAAVGRIGDLLRDILERLGTA